VVGPPKWQVYTGARCGGQKDLSLNMHSQQSMNYTHRVARGDVVQRRDTRQHFCDSRAVALRAAHRSRQGTRAWGRSLICKLKSESRPSQAYQHGDGTWEAAEPALPQQQTGWGPLARQGSAGCAGTQ